MSKSEMANNNNPNNRNTNLDDKPIGPMELGCLIFSTPFFLVVAVITFMVIFNVR
jgi:hypothetical protein